MLTDNLIKAFSKSRNIKESTIKSYKAAVSHYEYFHQMSTRALIDEAMAEEEMKVPLKNRTIKKRLLDFRTFLLDSNLSMNTVRTYFSRIKTFYRHFEIEIPYIVPIKADEEYISSYNDLPSKKDIKRACNISSLEFKAVILFISSSGCAKAETLSLSVGDFIEATSDYHNGGPVNDILGSLNDRRDIVPTFYIKRIKTNKFYYAFCSSEASYYIVKYLLCRKNLSLKDKLFDFTDSSLIYNFKKVNDSLNMGFVGKYRFFRSHALRKFHASNIGLSRELIDELQGRAKTKVHEAYIKTNPIKLKEIYMDSMIFDEWIDEYKNSDEKEDKGIVIENQEINIYINICLDGMEYRME